MSASGKRAITLFGIGALVALVMGFLIMFLTPPSQECLRHNHYEILSGRSRSRTAAVCTVASKQGASAYSVAVGVPLGLVGLMAVMAFAGPRLTRRKVLAERSLPVGERVAIERHFAARHSRGQGNGVKRDQGLSAAAEAVADRALHQIAHL